MSKFLVDFEITAAQQKFIDDEIQERNLLDSGEYFRLLLRVAMGAQGPVCVILTF